MRILLEEFAVFVKEVVEFLVDLDADFVFDLDVQVDGDGLRRRFDLDGRCAGGDGHQQPEWVGPFRLVSVGSTLTDGLDRKSGNQSIDQVTVAFPPESKRTAQQKRDCELMQKFCDKQGSSGVSVGLLGIESGFCRSICLSVRYYVLTPAVLYVCLFVNRPPVSLLVANMGRANLDPARGTTLT